MKLRHVVSTAACAALFLFQTGLWAQSNAATGKAKTQSSTGIATKGSMTDSQFLKHAAQGGMFEVQMGQVANQRGATEPVRQFGQRMVDDHSKMNDQAKQVAGQKGITLPTSLDAKHQATIQRLSKLSGERFDQAYAQTMVTDHKNDIAEFEKVANSNSDLKSFAEEALPMLREHLSVSENLWTAVRGETTSSKTPGSHEMDTSSSRKPKK